MYNWETNENRTRLVYTGKEDEAGPSVPFKFNQIFLPDSTTEQLYDECVRPNVEQYMKGINTTVRWMRMLRS